MKSNKRQFILPLHKATDNNFMELGSPRIEK